LVDSDSGIHIIVRIAWLILLFTSQQNLVIIN
jgi:hypothetical protein